MDIILLLQGVHKGKGAQKGTEINNSIDPICSSVTLLKDEKNILVDTGNRGFEQEIVTRLREQGLQPEDVDVVFNTHSHFDHCSNNHLFINAKIIHGNNVWSPRKTDTYNVIQIPGVTIMKTPGHYQDHQSIFVEKDQAYVIAGDAVREDIIRDKEKWQSSNDEYKQSLKKIFEIADVIFPGHGRIIKGSLLKELRYTIYSRK
jgi:glyoxylase-like metal-dependent hydrolase (beta-lactamase superfamily II)